MNSKDQIQVSDKFLEKLTFNFSFISKSYSVDSKNVDKNKARNVLKKLVEASSVDYEVLLELNNIESIPKKEIREKMMSIPSEFKKTGRFDKCSTNYLVIKGSDLRIIGKINPHTRIFYILAIDTDFELYDHGNHKGVHRS